MPRSRVDGVDAGRWKSGGRIKASGSTLDKCTALWREAWIGVWTRVQEWDGGGCASRGVVEVGLGAVYRKTPDMTMSSCR